MTAGVWCVVVAAGSGARFGSAKQYEQLGDRRLLDWALADAASVARQAPSGGVVLVVPPDRAGDPEPTVDRVVAGGATRSDSVRAGLVAVPAAADIVVVHDAARPFAGVELFERVVAAVRAGADAAIPGVEVVDTIKRVAHRQVVETVDRSDLVAVQTPQAFRAAALRRAHRDRPEATDDAALVEALGGQVAVVAGHVLNRKITTLDDLDQARAHVGRAAMG